MAGFYSYENFHYNIAPPFMVVVFTLLTQLLVWVGSSPGTDFAWKVVGSSFSWKVVLSMFVWGFLSLKIPGKIYKGPKTSFGYIPIYKANGLQYYAVTTALYITILYFFPTLAVDIKANFSDILATCNIIALALCCFLMYKGKYFPEAKEELPQGPVMYKFFAGVELHPRLFGVDVKQLTNCRFGLMAWGLLVMSFFVSGWIEHGFHLGYFLCVLSQIIYLGKFFWWETGYFTTLDITLDRAGYYICWGCIVWVPALYTFSSYYMASYKLLIGKNTAWIIFIFGLISTVLNYWSDLQKLNFRESQGNCFVWGRRATSVPASYKTNFGGTKKTSLLTSGFWGISRHMNYLFEIFIAFSWSLPALGLGMWPFLYPFFLTVLLVHRTFRDEKKCQEKYGEGWTLYCQKVPYRMIPGVF